MAKHTEHLGLPIEYQQLPQFFDAHNINAETDKKNAVIEALLSKHHVHSVYDITCGTGSQALYLAQKNYDVMGSDLCSALIKQAQIKAGQLNLPILFEIADMRSAQKGKFDAVISIFSAIGHLSAADFAIALKNISTNLKPDGLYIFDIFNLEALTDEVIATFFMDIQDEHGGIQFRNQQMSELDKEDGLLISHDQYTIQEGDQKKHFTNTFSLQIYTFKQIKTILEHNQFKVLEVSDLDGCLFMPKTSLNMLIVAQKAS